MNRLQRAMSKYFDGWERYGLRQEDGRIQAHLPNEMPTLSLLAQADDELFMGLAEVVRACYVLHANLEKADLSRHQDNGRWKPGRFVFEDARGGYHVWVRYDQPIDAPKNCRDPGLWVKLQEGGRVVHCDRENDEKAPRVHKMSPVFIKLARYFGHYELGVYQEATGQQDGKVWAVEPADNTTGYLKAMNAQGRHIFIRPDFEKEPHFMMHDDLDKEGLAKYHKEADGRWKPGRLVVQSSPGNYQVWIKSDRPLNVEEKKHWLAQMHSDPGASPLHRWGRCPGFRNRKGKYLTEKGYPLARLEWVDWKNTAKVPAVELKEEPRHTKNFAPLLQPPKCAGELPTRDQYFKGVDGNGKARESEQDFAYMLALLRRGVDDETVKSRVQSERTDWDNHQGPKRMEHYLEKSLQGAKSIIGSSGYRIDIYKGQKKTRLKSVSVTGIPAGQDHKAYLSQRARDIVVKEGYEPAGVIVDIQQVKVDRGLDKAKARDGSREKTMNVR